MAEVRLHNNVAMPVLGLGTTHSGGYSHDAVVYAIKNCGYRLIDTARRYGNEEHLGKAIQESGVHREDLFLATKLWPTDYGFQSTINAFRLSRKRLGSDYLVVIVTTAWSDPDTGEVTKRGITCSSFNSISTDPPIASFCITTPSRMDKLLRRSNKFAINMLAEEQVGLCLYFSKKAQEGNCQFADVGHSMNEGLPILNEISAALHCRAIKVDTIGDHNVWYGEITKAEIMRPCDSPLLYYDRSFRSIGDEVFIRAFETLTLKFEEWTHEAHLRMAWNYIRQLGRKEATPLIKKGIKKYNTTSKIQLERGFNETITEFYIHMVAGAIAAYNPPNVTFEDFLQKQSHLAEPGLLFKYYSKQRVNAPEAKEKVLAPDLVPLPE